MSHATAAEPRKSLLAEVEVIGVDLRKPELLEEIVLKNPEIAELVIEAIGELQKAFGDRATIAVDPFIDPEVVDAQPSVFVVAVTRLSFREADEILERVVDGWWLDNHSRANYLVSLATEFV